MDDRLEARGSPDEPPVMQAQDLARHYRVPRGLWRGHEEIRALQGVSFALQRGRTLAVVGESGSGKSTLARQLTLMEPATSGRLWIEGVEVTIASNAQQAALRRKTQMVFQNPMASLNPRQTIGAILDEPLLLNTNDSKAQRRDRVRAMLDQVGLRSDHLDRHPHMFSGGQRQRIAIARALILSPAVVVADEPTSALDVSIQAQILNLMRDLQTAHRVSYVFISHNLAVVEHVADEVMVLYQGRVVEIGPKSRVLQAPLHPYTQGLQASVPRLRPDPHAHPGPHHPPSFPAVDSPTTPSQAQGCVFQARCPHRLDLCTQRAPELTLTQGRHVACHRVEADGR